MYYPLLLKLPQTVKTEAMLRGERSRLNLFWTGRDRSDVGFLPRGWGSWRVNTCNLVETEAAEEWMLHYSLLLERVCNKIIRCCGLCNGFFLKNKIKISKVWYFNLSDPVCVQSIHIIKIKIKKKKKEGQWTLSCPSCVIR